MEKQSNVKHGLPNLTTYSDAALESLAKGHERPDFRAAATAEIEARTKKPGGKIKKSPAKPAPKATVEATQADTAETPEDV